MEGFKLGENIIGPIIEHPTVETLKRAEGKISEAALLKIIADLQERIAKLEKK